MPDPDPRARLRALRRSAWRVGAVNLALTAAVAVTNWGRYSPELRLGVLGGLVLLAAGAAGARWALRDRPLAAPAVATLGRAVLGMLVLSATPVMVLALLGAL